MATEKQIHANQANAKLSSGPVTDQGKATASHNAVKTGLTGQTVLLKTDDVELYHAHSKRFSDKFEPANEDEATLVQDLADTEWRLARIPSLEAGVLALGRIELAPLFADQDDPETRAQLLEAKVFLNYRRDLSNLSLQQARLRKHRESVTTELKEMQRIRQSKAFSEAWEAAQYYEVALKKNLPFDPTDFGFVFTLDDLFKRVADVRCQQSSQGGPENRYEVVIKRYRQQVEAEYHARYGTK
jgi:hypothetical protein